MTRKTPFKLGLVRNLLMMADHLIDDEAQEFFGEDRIELRILGELTQPSDLALLSAWIGWWQGILCLETAYRLRDLEPLGQHIDQDRVDIVDALPKMVQ